MLTMPWDRQIASYRTAMVAAGCSPDTIRLRAHYLRRLAEKYPDRSPFELTIDDLAEYLGRTDWAPETRKSARAALRSFYRWALETDRTARNPARLLAPVRVPPGCPRPAPEDVILEAMSTAGRRERRMVMLAAYAGLRRGEIARVHRRDVIGGTLHIRGKGGRVRAIPLHPILAAELGGDWDGYLFPGAYSGHLSPDRVGVLLSRLLGPGWSGHSVRHTFASKAYAGTRDLRAIQTLLGHSKPETTARYTAVPDGALRAAVEAA